MLRTLLNPRIHRVAVTLCTLHCEGSCAIDEDLPHAACRMPHAANIAESEQIHIWNIPNGERFVTNATPGQPGSGIVSANGPAAHCACPGDFIVIAAFAQVHEDQAATHTTDEAAQLKEALHALATPSLRR